MIQIDENYFFNKVWVYVGSDETYRGTQHSVIETNREDNTIVTASMVSSWYGNLNRFLEVFELLEVTEEQQ